ncbi:MAG: hypothetical protein IKZ66_07665 [Schwartzia sp.]|nr:hypothetical protein [Schwartzia sp. (in: firmicutes)]
MQPNEYAAFKRALETYTADPEWRTAFTKNPVGALEDFPSLDAYDAYKAIGIVLGEAPRDDENPYYAEYLRRYRAVGDFIETSFREEAFTDKRLYRFGRIALRRAQVGNRCFRAMPHIRYFPVLFELSDGCRQGCSFCGLAAPRWRSDFLATAENRRLWRAVLVATCEKIGAIVSQCACYFATEPLDNPDYEVLLADFHEITGDYPQTTTVRGSAEPDRLRAFMKQLGSKRLQLAGLRFSVRTLAEFRRLAALYTPEELADVELLLNNPESLTSYSASGRAREMNLPPGKKTRRYSISCLAGFLVNMARQTVAFTEPVFPDAECPTGVLVYEKRSFADIREYREILEEMAARYAYGQIDAASRVALHEEVTVSREGNITTFRGDGVSFRMGGNLHFQKAVSLIREKPHSLHEIFDTLQIGAFVGAELAGKLQMLYEKGYLRMIVD